jgi:hypothetical protein
MCLMQEGDWIGRTGGRMAGGREDQREGEAPWGFWMRLAGRCDTSCGQVAEVFDQQRVRVSQVNEPLTAKNRSGMMGRACGRRSTAGGMEKKWSRIKTSGQTDEEPDEDSASCSV